MKIIINTATHGDEKIGQRVAREIKKIPIINGRLLITTANELGNKRNKRFIDQDLNRSFPGKKNGNYEERRAYELLPIIKSADIVIDIHSTTSDLKDALVITSFNKKTREYIDVIGPKYVLYMKATGKTGLISFAKIGLAFEYGKDKDPKTIKKVITDIKKLLTHLQMIAPTKQVATRKSSPTFFSVHTAVSKPKNARLDSKIRNYTLIKKGQIYASANNKPIRATKDFYPILFGQKNYLTIFGFAATKMS